MTHEKETECYLTNLIYRVYRSTLLVAHLHFSQPYKAKQKCKRATKPTLDRQMNKMGMPITRYCQKRD